MTLDMCVYINLFYMSNLSISLSAYLFIYISICLHSFIFSSLISALLCFESCFYANSDGGGGGGKKKFCAKTVRYKIYANSKILIVMFLLKILDI